MEILFLSNSLHSIYLSCSNVSLLSQGFDTHKNNNAKLDDIFKDVNNSLHAFVKEMKSMNLWNDVTLVQTSEFGRTLTPNGSGTDHGWGGNYMLMGKLKKVNRSTIF